MSPNAELHSPEPYLHHLRRLPFVRTVRLMAGRNRESDGVLRIETSSRYYEFEVEQITIERLNYALLESKLARMRTTANPWILFAPYVTANAGEYLRAKDVNFVDRLGNCSIALSDDHIARIEGRRPRPEATVEREAGGPATYRVFFALLARPELAGVPVRVLAEQAGVSKTRVSAALNQLNEMGIIGQSHGKRLLLNRTTLEERWLAVYAQVVRPRLRIGRYMPQERVPSRLEAMLEESVGDDGDERWAYGGAAAAFRLTGHYRGDETVIHVQTDAAVILRRGRFLPAREGIVHIHRVPGPVAFESPRLRVVHPLLVYSELMAHGGPRERETAAEVYARWLTPSQ